MIRKPFSVKPLVLVMSLVSGAAVAQDHVVEEVLVQASPIRDSQLAAIDAKRNANNVVDIISSDTIGRFPDQNLADSLGRVPGVAIERDQGQARYINLRGTPFRYTSLAFDGVDVNGADDGRVPRFDSFPSVITNRIEVNKAILPSMPGESVAGYINIQTFSPFDKEGVSVAADIGRGEQNLGGGDIEKQNFRVSYSADQWGVVAYASENSREQVTDNRELDLEHNDAGELVVNSLDYRSYLVERSDQAYGATIEFRGDGALSRAFLSTLHSEFTDEEERNQFAFDLENAVGIAGENIALSATRMLQNGNYESSTDTHTLGADFALGEWNLEARINRTETSNEMYLPIIRGGSSATGSYDLTDIEDPLLYLDQNLGDLEYAYNMDMRVTQDLGITSDKFKIDASRDLVLFNQDATLSLGVQHDSRDADGHVMSQTMDRTNMVAVDVDSFNTGKLWDSNTTNSIGGTIYDNKALEKAWREHPNFQPIPVNDGDRIQIDETITGVYAMVDVDYDWGNVIVGARNEFTDYSSQGQTGEASRDFSNFLPSAHINVDVTDNQKWRLSYSSSVTRPGYTAWRATISESPLSRTITEGNPNLKAEKSHGFDTSYEWYFAEASLLSAGFFYRDIEQVIYTESTRLDTGWSHNKPVNGGDGKIQGIEFNFQGSAADLLPEPFNGFGISANATFLDSEFDTLDGRTLGLPGTSNRVYNASIFYENYGFSARVNYQYRDEWISPIESPDELWGAQKRVDMTVSYDLPEKIYGTQVTLYANGNNLTNEVDVRYAANQTVNQVESYGRSWLMGVRVNY